MEHETIYTQPLTAEEAKVMVRALSFYLGDLVQNEDFEAAKKVSQLLTELAHVI